MYSLTDHVGFELNGLMLSCEFWPVLQWLTKLCWHLQLPGIRQHPLWGSECRSGRCRRRGGTPRYLFFYFIQCYWRSCVHDDRTRGSRTRETWDGLPPTLETVNGVLKSRPPTSRKPHGEGPFSVTVCGMLAISTRTDRWRADRQTDRLRESEQRDHTACGSRSPPPAARQRGPVWETVLLRGSSFK